MSQFPTKKAPRPLIKPSLPLVMQMRASELQQQLAQLRERPGVQGVTGRLGNVFQKKKQRWIASLLYEPKEALAYDVSVLRRRAVDAFDTLSSTWDPELLSVAELFSAENVNSSYLRKKRNFLTEKECTKLDALLNRFLDHIGRYWQEEDALHCLEYLIRQYSIQRFNVDALLSMALPFHDTALFVRLVQILELPKSSPFLFLNAVAKNAQPLKRSVFIENCIRNPILLSFLSSAVIRTATELSAPNVPLISFFTLCCIEVISSPHFQLSEQFVRQFIPCVFFSLQNPLQHELHVSGLCVLSHLSRRVPLSYQTCSAAVSDIFLYTLKGIETVSLRRKALVDSFLFLNLFILEQTTAQTSRQLPLSTGMRVIPRPVLQQFVKPHNRADIIPALKMVVQVQRVDITPVVGFIFRSIFEELERIGDKADGFKRAAREFSLDLLSQFSGLFSPKTRIAICLSIFESFLSSNAKVAGGLPALVLETLEQRYPTTTTTAIRHFVAIHPKDDRALRRVIVASCTALDGEALEPVAFDTAKAGDERFNLCCAMTDKDAVLRLEAVRIALDRFKRSCSTGVSNKGSAMLCKVLLDRAADVHLPIALEVFQCTELWANSPLSETLTQLFYQFYFLLKRVAATPPWMLTSFPENADPLSSLLPTLVASSVEIKQRFVCVLNTLAFVLEQSGNSALIMETFDRLGPLFFPFVWGLVASDSQDLELKDAVARLFSLTQFNDARTNGVAKQNSVERSLGPTSTAFSLTKHSLAEALLNTYSPVWDKKVDDTVNQGGAEDAGKVTLAPQDFALGAVTVISYQQTGTSCPVVEPLSDVDLGGAWAPLAWLEAFVYLASSSSLTEELVDRALLRLPAIWVTVHHEATAVGKRRVADQLVAQCSELCLRRSANALGRYHLCVFLSLLDAFPSMEVLASTSSHSVLLPTAASILAGKSPSIVGSSMGLPTSALTTLVKLKAAQLIKLLLGTESKSCAEPFFAPLLTTVFVHVFLDVEDTDVRSAVITLLKPCLKYIKRHSSATTPSSKVYSPKCWDGVLSPSWDALPGNLKSEFASFNVAHLLRCLLRNEAATQVTSTRRCIETTVSEHPDIARSLLLSGCLSSLPNYLKRLCSLLKTAVSLQDVLPVCSVIWRHCLSAGCSASSDWFAVAQQLVVLLADVSSENANELVSSLLLPCMERWALEASWSAHQHCLAYALIAAVIRPVLLLETSSNVHWFASLVQFAAAREATLEDEDPVSYKVLLSETLSARCIVEVLQQRLRVWTEDQDIKELLILFDCCNATCRDDERVGAWSEELYASALTLCEQWAKRAPPVSELSESNSAVIPSFLRCLTSLLQRCAPKHQASEAAAHTVRAVLHAFSPLISEPGRADGSLVVETTAELCVGLTQLTTSCIELFQSADIVQPLIETLSQKVLVVALSESPRFLMTPSMASALRCFLATLCHTQNGVFGFLVPRVFKHLVPVIVGPPLRSCCISFARDPSGLCVTERDRLGKSLVVFGQGCQGVTSDNVGGEAMSITALFLCVIESWVGIMSDASLNDRSKGSSSSSSNSLDAPNSEQWILSVCDMVLCTLHASLQREVLQHCVRLVRDTPSLSVSTEADTQKDFVHLLGEGLNSRCRAKVYYTTLRFVVDQVFKRPELHLKALKRLSPAKVVAFVAALRGVVSNPTAVKEIQELEEEDAEALVCTYEWLTSLVVSLLAISRKKEKEKKHSEALLAPILVLAAKTAKDLVEMLPFPTGPLPLLIVAAVKASKNADASGNEERSLQCKVYKKMMPSLCRLLAQQCYVPHFSTLSAENDGIQLLTGRQFDTAVRQLPLVEAAVDHLLHYTGEGVTQKVDVWHIVACLMITYGPACSSVFVSSIVPVLRLSLAQEKNSLDVLTLPVLERVLNPLFFALFYAVPSKDLLPEFNVLIVSFLDFWTSTISDTALNVSSDTLRTSRFSTLVSSVGIVCSSPARHYLSSHLGTLLCTVLLNPAVLRWVLEEASSNQPFMTVAMLLSRITAAANADVWHEHMAHSFVATFSSSARQTETLLSFFDLWRHVSSVVLTHPNLNYLLDALIPCITADVKALMSQEKDWVLSVRCAVALSYLGNALRTRSPNALVSVHKRVAMALVSGVHGAVELFHARLQHRANRYNDAAGADKSHFFLSESTSLSTWIQSGTEFELLKRCCPQDVLSSFGHPAAIIDASRSSSYATRDFAFLEAGVLKLWSSWLPKMTNAQLQPLLKSLLKYAAHRRSLLMSQACSGSLPVDSSASSQVVTMSRDASSARVFVLLFATVAWDLEELGILSCLWDIAPHLKEVLAQCQRNAFQLSMLQDSGNDMKNNTERSRKKKLKLTSSSCTLSTSWWWFDLGIPVMLCLSKVAQVAPSIPLVDQFFPIIVDALDVFSVLPRPIAQCGETGLLLDTSDAAPQRMAHTWLWCMGTTLQHLIAFVLKDTIKVRSILQPWLQKTQSSTNANVRYCGIAILYHLWVSHGLSLSGTLTDSLQIVVELLEDNDDGVERITALLVKYIERLTGETLQSRLGH